MGEILSNLGISWPKLIAQTVNFGIVLFVLWKFAYKPILDLLEQRRKKIEESVTNADKIKAELDAVDEKIAQAMQKGGPGLEEYLDLTMRIKTVRKIDESLQNKFAGAREITRQVQELRQRQTKELDEAESAIDVAKQELETAKRRLRSILR